MAMGRGEDCRLDLGDGEAAIGLAAAGMEKKLLPWLILLLSLFFEDGDGVSTGLVKAQGSLGLLGVRFEGFL